MNLEQTWKKHKAWKDCLQAYIFCANMDFKFMAVTYHVKCESGAVESLDEQEVVCFITI